MKPDRSETTDGKQTRFTPLRPPLLTIALISLTALAYELLLMRLFSIIQYHHFAYMIISLAMLGYGASGAFITIFSSRLMNGFQLNFPRLVLLFSLATATCFPLAQHIQFNPLEFFWDSRQAFKLFIIYLLLALPFFFAAGSIALSLSFFRSSSQSIYCADLIGAGCGSLIIICLLYLLFPMTILKWLVSLAALSVVTAMMELKTRSWSISLGAALVLCSQFILPGQLATLNISPYKSLEQALRIGGTGIIEQHSSPFGLLSLVESKRIPWRHAPGVSIKATKEPPEQLALFTDADDMTVINRFSGKYEEAGYLDMQTSALAYHLKPVRKALLIGLGGGASILQANLHKTSEIHIVEMNRQVIEIGKKYSAFAGNILQRPEVMIHLGEARGFIQTTREQYDLIQMELQGSFNAASAGLYGLQENYLFTVQALQSSLNRLTPEGFLSITGWIKVPPRDTLKLFATALKALEDNAVQSPENRLVLIRGWQTATLLIKNSPLTSRELDAIRFFCDKRAFDLAYYPGITASIANRHNRLQQPYFFDGCQALTSDHADQFIRKYKFDLTPSSDDRPYFSHFLKPATIPEILRLRDQSSNSLLEQGYLILLATLAQALVAGVILIVTPIMLFKRNTETPMTRARLIVYFSALGLGFLFLEISYIQKFILFLSHPLFATSVVVTTFLLFAGIGSGITQSLVQTHSPKKIVTVALSVVLVLGGVSTIFLDALFNQLIMQPLWVKALLSVTMIAPIAVCLGMPFPLAIHHLGKTKPHLIPWAWCINGCASVVSAVLAMLLAIHFGFTRLTLTGLLLYGIAMYFFPATHMKPNKKRV